MSETMTVECAYCKTPNRVVKGRDNALCGRCREPLTGSAGAVAVTERNFRAEVLESRTPVLVDCWASWCGPCRVLGPTIDALAGRLAGQVKVVKVNVDESPAIAQRLGVQSLPTLLAFRDGQVIGRQVGAGSGEQIIAWLRQVRAL
jgi:thioredoxin